MKPPVGNPPVAAVATVASTNPLAEDVDAIPSLGAIATAPVSKLNDGGFATVALAGALALPAVAAGLVCGFGDAAVFAQIGLAGSASEYI